MAATAPILERALRRDRALVLGALALVILLCWAYLLTGGGAMPRDMAPMPAAPWTPGHVLLMFVMWALMMAAMMLPSAAPVVLLYATIARNRRARGQPAVGALVFALGYVGVWGVFSAVAVALQFALERAALLSPMMETTSIALAAVVLVAAGAYQWTPWKDACLRHCRSPMDFVLMHWREGTAGALAMGARHGAYCLGCCWVLMLLLFVGGVMNLLWIGGLAVYVLLEKVLPGGRWVGRGAGAGLVAWGLAVGLN